MVLFLTSSPTGPLDGSWIVDGFDPMNGFVDNLKKYWKPESRCLIITASPDRYAANDQMVDFFDDVLHRVAFSHAAFDLWDGRTKDFSKETLLSYDVIFLGGGHVPTQNAFFHHIGLAEKIAEFPGIVIGISAGTMDCAKMVYAQPEEPGESVDPNYIRFMPGLGLTKLNICPHYQMVKDYDLDGRRLYEDITFEDSYGHQFLVLPDGSYVLSAHGVETLYGEGYLLADGQMKQICRKGDKVKL